MEEDVDATERSTETLVQKCRKLANSYEFNLGVGVFALTVGVIITAVTFQDQSNITRGSSFLVGPIFIATGIVVIGRSLLFRFLKNYSVRWRRRHRSGGRHQGQQEYTGHSQTNSAVDIRFADDPPPYETAIASSTTNIACSQMTIATTVDSINGESLPPPPSYEEATRHPPVILPEPRVAATAIR